MAYLGIYHFVSAKTLAALLHRIGYRYNRLDGNGVEKFDTALLGADNKRLDSKSLIDRLTSQQLTAVAAKYTKNPPASPDALVRQYEPDYLENWHFF